MPTLAQVLVVTGRPWTAGSLVDLFHWLRRDTGVPAFTEEVTYCEAMCLWSHDLCHHIFHSQRGAAEEVFQHIHSAVRWWVPYDCQDERTFSHTKHLLVVVDDRWVFCSDQQTAWDLQQHVAVSCSAICDAVKSTAYNLSLLATRYLAECPQRTRDTGRPLKDSPHVDETAVTPGPATSLA